MTSSATETHVEVEMHADLDEAVAAGMNSVWEQTCDMMWKTSDKGPEDDTEVEEILDIQGESRRKSNRKRTTRRPFSPDKTGQKRGRSKKGTSPASSVRRKRKPVAKKSQSNYYPSRPFDTLTNGTPFCCDLCKSPYICNRGNKHDKGRLPIKPPKHKPSPRHKVDPLTGRMMQLCNACGLAFDRPPRICIERELPPPEEKEKYLEEAKQFAQRLCTELNDPDADRLFCPSFKYKACGCIQSYILFDGEQEHSSLRAEKLLTLLKEAKQLSALKCYSTEEARKPVRSRKIGLGNGMKKSKLFEDFVMEKRQYLKETLKLCERGAQKVLLYSNNFIHKKLKSEDSNCRARRVIGKAALGLLPPLTELENKKCCIDNCVLIAATHSRLLQEWRERATEGQAAARSVLAEMLTPTGGARSNCYKFISMVTGCSSSLIGCVNDQMRRTGGDRKPPTHGLKKYWQANQKRVKDATIADSEQGGGNLNSVSCTGGDMSVSQSLVTSQDDSGTMDVNASSTSYQFELQRQQLLQLQRQLTEQQTQIQQHQQLVQQQLLQQSLIQQLTESGNCAQVLQAQPVSVGNVQTPSTTGNNVQPIIVTSNQLTSLENSQPLSILQQIQPVFNAQTTPQTAVLPVQTTTCTPQSATVHPHNALQQPALMTASAIAQQQQPVQTVQVMIANIELPSQSNQSVQVITPQQQQQQQQHNTLLPIQQQQMHIIPQQHPSHVIAGNQPQQNAGVAQTLSLPNTQGLTVQIRPPADHTYSQSNPRPADATPQTQPLTQTPFQCIQVIPRQLSATDANNGTGVASVALTTPASNSGFSIYPQTTPSSSSPLQMLASFTAEPFDGCQTPQTSRGWPSEIPAQPVTVASVSPAFGVAPSNGLQSQTVPLATSSLNIQTALQQIFSIVNVGGGSGLCSSSLASDTSSPVSSPTKSGPSPILQLGMLPSSQSVLHSASPSINETGSSAERDLNCSVFLQQAQLADTSLMSQSANNGNSTVGELEQNSPDTQESHQGEVTGSPLSSEMMNLLSESCD